MEETCLIPLGENVALKEDNNHTFITECFFLCHQAINQGFHVVHEKFLKINKDLHDIQRWYQSLRSRYLSDDVEPVRIAKLRMEKSEDFYCRRHNFVYRNLM